MAPAARRVIEARAAPVERSSRARSAKRAYDGARAQLTARIGRRIDVIV
ncbi:MAG: hypothetical protein ABL957_08525 [Parvularculaceae bacterium]